MDRAHFRREATQQLTAPLDSEFIMNKLTEAQNQILRALRRGEAETVDIGLLSAENDLSVAEILRLAEATKPSLKISHTTRLQGDLLRKKKEKTAKAAAAKGW